MKSVLYSIIEIISGKRKLEKKLAQAHRDLNEARWNYEGAMMDYDYMVERRDMFLQQSIILTEAIQTVLKEGGLQYPDYEILEKALKKVKEMED